MLGNCEFGSYQFLWEYRSPPPDKTHFLACFSLQNSTQTSNSLGNFFHCWPHTFYCWNPFLSPFLGCNSLLKTLHRCLFCSLIQQLYCLLAFLSISLSLKIYRGWFWDNKYFQKHVSKVDLCKDLQNCFGSCLEISRQFSQDLCILFQLLQEFSLLDTNYKGYYSIIPPHTHIYTKIGNKRNFRSIKSQIRSLKTHKFKTNFLTGVNAYKNTKIAISL